MLPRNLESTDRLVNWQDLSVGAPTIIAFANLCGQAMSGQSLSIDDLDEYARALLVAARPRGVFDIRGNREGFDSVERFLAVAIEVEDGRYLVFRQKEQPRETIRFLDGFRQLCQAGLIMHHLHRDFSLTRLGFELADELSVDDYRDLLAFAQESEH